MSEYTDEMIKKGASKLVQVIWNMTGEDVHERRILVVEMILEQARDYTPPKTLAQEVTDDFCKAFNQRADFIGPAAELVACGQYPEGVDYNDKRVQLITLLCMVGDVLPICTTCKGGGLFTMGMSRDMCADCFGFGVQHLGDRELVQERKQKREFDFKIIRTLLQHSWGDIDFQYEGLTAAEKTLLTREDFTRLAKWVRR